MLTSEATKRSRLLFGKFQGVYTAAAREKGWTDVAQVVSSVSSASRTVSEVKKKWSALKCTTKGKASDLRRELGATGGGEFKAFLTAAKEKILGIMGEVCVAGLPGGIDVAAGNYEGLDIRIF